MGELKIESWNMLENQRFKKQAKNLYIIGSKRMNFSCSLWAWTHTWRPTSQDIMSNRVIFEIKSVNHPHKTDVSKRYRLKCLTNQQSPTLARKESLQRKWHKETGNELVPTLQRHHTKLQVWTRTCVHVYSSLVTYVEPWVIANILKNKIINVT